MYLKSLEIQGFKSFPDKTRLTFDRPVTAIVGPNGSGKSNIADAILWVLGEQSTRALRGGKMEDVIFGGTLRRPPVGFAEVTLVLDNSDRALNTDYTEVAVTRRYYRSGESEYYINRQPVRLKDINELFMDTGLGREGYSIIGQGRIDAILSAKSTDRREVFEEAAGISRYRHRKEEAERKLQLTEDSLLRINDKISELSLQLEPLREQAETARKYLLLRDELRALEISVWMDALDGIVEQAQKAEGDLAAATAQKEQAAQKLEECYERAADLSEKMHGKDAQLEALRAEIAACEARGAGHGSDIAVLKANLENISAEIERVRRELEEQEGRDGGLKAQIDERLFRISELQGESERIRQAISKRIVEFEAVTESAGASSKMLDGHVAQEDEMTAELGEQKSRLSALSSAAQEMYDRERRLSQEAAAAAERLRELEKELSARSSELSSAREELKRLKNAAEGYALRLDSRRKKADLAAEKKMRMTMELGALKSRISLLTEMERDYQGYSKAVRLVMQEARRGVLKNVHGTVAGLLRTDARYAVAIETALGGAMQHIIVETEEDGKEAINYLKRHDGGRATFLPVSAVRGGVLDKRGLSGEPGYEGLAIDLVSFDDKFAGIYRSLLGRVAVVDTLENAIRIARKNGYSFRIVTLDGQVVNAGGSMTGGSALTNAGIISRADELRRLESQHKALGEELSRLERELSDALRESQAAEYEHKAAVEELRAAEEKVMQLEMSCRHLEELVESAARALEAQKAEAEALLNRLSSNEAETEKTRERIAALEKMLAEVRAAIAAALEGQQQLSAERERLQGALSELRAQLASVEAEREALARAVSELSELRRALTGGRNQQLSHLEELRRRREATLAELSEKEAAMERIAEQAETLKAMLERAAAEKMEMEAERLSCEKAAQDKNQEVLALERECARLEQKRLAAQMEEKQIIDRLWDNYGLTRSEAMAARLPLSSVPDARRRIAALREEISALGNPNVGAIEEFERVGKRYEFLAAQRDDIEKAKGELEQLIRDLTAEMRALFKREFEVIRQSFMETFLEFFGGGQASLELEDPDDVLTSGIEIKVQPPGKSLKTLTLLSGGEKAFVAIALYFAILKVRPTPFVVFDEIEAALDEANVRRFAANMRKMSGKTQMIVITHHRGTMEEADMLYGVTMQEQGVSKVIGIDLSEAEKALKKEA